jgi:hypothetical protein
MFMVALLSKSVNVPQMPPVCEQHEIVGMLEVS